MTKSRFASAALACLLAAAPSAFGQFPSLPKIDPPKLPGIPGLPGPQKPADSAPKKPGDKQGDKRGGKKTDEKEGRQPAPGETTPADRPTTPGESGATSTPPDSAPKSPGNAASGQRPAFVDLVGDQCRQDCAMFGAQQRAVMESLLEAFAVADRGPAPLQLAFANDVIKTLRTISVPRMQEGMPAAQVDAIRKAAAESQRQGKSSYQSFADRLEGGIRALERWISAEDGRTGLVLSFPSKGGGGRKDGLRTLKWGPVPGWTDDVVRIEFDDGVVFERQSAAATTPIGIRGALVPDAAEWPGVAPAFDALRGKLDLLVANRTVEGLDGVTMAQIMLVVDGELAAVQTQLSGGAAVLAAAQKQWAAVTKDVGQDAEVQQVLRLGSPIRSHVRWKGESGTVTAIVVNDMPREIAQSLVLKSAEYEFGVKNCVKIEVDDPVRIAVGEYVQDLEDMTRDEILALIPAAGKRVLILDCVAVGADQTTYCRPKVTLVDASGASYEDVGEAARHPILMGLRGNRLTRGGVGADVPFDVQLSTLLKLNNGDPGGFAESHGARARVFYVPADAKGLSARLEGCDASIALPDFAGREAWARAPVETRQELALAESQASKDQATACVVTRQWSRAIEDRAGKSAVENAERASRQAAADKEAEAAAEAERKRKLESSFD